MRRAPRQKMSGAANDWCQKGWRRLFALNERSGRGRFTKRQLARQRRREPLPLEE